MHKLQYHGRTVKQTERTVKQTATVRWIAVAILITFGTSTAASAELDSAEQLVQQLRALELERVLLKRPGEAYLVFDLRVPIVHLKAAGRVLRTMSPSRVQLDELLSNAPRILTLLSRIKPISLEPGTEGLRLRGRVFPLDFRTRLVEGPRDRTLFDYGPLLLVGPAQLKLDGIGIALPETDIKALSSALDPGSAAILIPPG